MKAGLAVAAGLVVPAGSFAAVPSKDIASGGPLTHVYVGNELSCQVAHTDDASPELYPPRAIPGDCGTMVAVGGTLYIPDFPNHDSSAASLSGTPFTPVSQSEVSGAGTTASPFQVTTVADAGPSGLRVTQVDSYIVGQEAYRTDVVVSNSSAGPISAILYRAGDCYLQESDSGFGFVDAGNSAPGCSANANNSPAGRIEQWFPISAGARYIEAGFSEVWAAVNAKAPFPNTCRCTERIDNGAGISWSIDVPAGGQVTRSHFTTFSPAGRAGPPPPVNPPPSGPPPRSVTQPPGSCRTTPPGVCLDGPSDIDRLGCVRIGDFAHRFRVKLKKTRGGLLVNRVSRVTVVYFRLDRNAAGSDRRRPFFALVSGAALTPGRHALRADVRLKIPKFQQRRYPGRFRRTSFRRKLLFRFSTCQPGVS